MATSVFIEAISPEFGATLSRKPNPLVLRNLRVYELLLENAGFA
jgi:hypothetical protein